MLSDMEKKTIAIKFYINQIEYERLITYANKRKILIANLMRELVDKLDVDSFIEPPIEEPTKISIHPKSIKKESFGGMGEIF